MHPSLHSTNSLPIRQSHRYLSEEEEDNDSDKPRHLATNCTSSSSLPAAATPPFSDQVLEKVLESVLQFITFPCDRNACSLVCRCWHHSVPEALMHSHLSGPDPGRVPVFARALPRPQGPPPVRRLPPGWGAGFMASAKAVAASRCTRSLRKLVVKRVTVSKSDLDLIGRVLLSFEELALICCDRFDTPGSAP